MQQKDVTIIKMRDQILQELDGVSKVHLKTILNEFDVKQYLNTKLCEIHEHEVIVENAQGSFSLEADTVVIALGYVPIKELASNLKDVIKNTLVVGGAVKISNALIAAREGVSMPSRCSGPLVRDISG